MAMKSISIRLDDELLYKLHVVADYEGRSANSQVVYMIRGLVERFEEKHGEIEYTRPKKKTDSSPAETEE